MNADASQNILVIKLGALGDVVMAEGLMRLIRARHKNARITLLSEPRYVDFMSPSPHFDAFETDSRPPRYHLPKMWALKRRLRAGRYDLVYDLQNSRRSRLYHRWLRPAKVRTHAAFSARELAAHPDIRWAGAPVDALLAARGIKPGFILLIPGSSARQPQKRYPGFARLAKALGESGYQCVTAPGPDEKDLCAGIPAAALTDGGRCLSLRQLAGLASYCGYVVGNDTGPTHLMAAASTRGLALSGGHAPVKKMFIGRVYDVMETDDFRALKAETVLERIKSAYPLARG